MNLDKKLAKYARQLNNPKYYGKILDILDKAEETEYEFQDFNEYDLLEITGQISAYYEAIKTDEEDRRMIKHCNSYWFIVSDKKYVLFETSSLLIAIYIYFKCNILMRFAKMSNVFMYNTIITTDNVENDIYIFRGAIKAAEYIGCDIFELEKERI